MLEDVKVNVKIILSALWVSIVLIYLYADLFAFYVPGHLEEVIAGEMAGMPITQVLLLVFMILMVIPSLMVFLSLILEAKVNRWTNIIVGILQIGLVLPSLIGSNIYFIFASGVEAVLLALIIYFAWTWPTKEGL